MTQKEISLMKQLEACLSISTGDQRNKIMELLSVLYQKRMKSTPNLNDWHFECRSVYVGLIHKADLDIYKDVINTWESCLIEKESTWAGLIIYRAFRMFLKDE